MRENVDSAWPSYPSVFWLDRLILMFESFLTLGITFWIYELKFWDWLGCGSGFISSTSWRNLRIQTPTVESGSCAQLGKMGGHPKKNSIITFKNSPSFQESFSMSMDGCKKKVILLKPHNLG